MEDKTAFAVGVATRDSCGRIIEVCYRAPLLSPPLELLSELFGEGDLDSDAACVILPVHEDRVEENKRRPMVATFCRLGKPIVDVADAYLKLNLISSRMLFPNKVNLSNLFNVLPTLAWTSYGAFTIDFAEKLLWNSRTKGQQFKIYSVDKFPPLLDYCVPSGVRIADSARVRLGAYLGEGTTVMPSGFINFNAGCHGPNMVEGRLSQGVMLDGGSDLGGGASTMGTLSGGNDQLISVGKDCLIGANAGIGISLGDKCTVEAGLYVTAGAKASLIIGDQPPKMVKASELSGRSNLLWRRNSQNGQLECLTNDKNFQLNQELHANN